MALPSLATCLAEAEAAYHDLITGKSVVSVTDQSGERVEYQRATARQLALYVADLRRRIGGRATPSTIVFTAVPRRY